MHCRALHIFLTMLALLPGFSQLAAQRVNFGLFASNGIILTPIVSELDFNSKQPMIIAGDGTISIGLNETFSALIEVEASSEYDIDVLLDAPYSLELVVGPQIFHIPFSIEIAYSNTGVSSADARNHATAVPHGFRSLSFPIIQRATNAPAPPPTPGHSSYSQTTAKAYLIMYGTLGPVPLNIPTGEYTATINLTVSYSSSTSTP
jgi:hypothetical protein